MVLRYSLWASNLGSMAGKDGQQPRVRGKQLKKPSRALKGGHM